ncbi:MAG: helix-turn-helix domain-containing protein [Chloroflexota bacterium]
MQENSEKGITTKQAKAITALLSERTAKDAAKRAGCSERTLYTWLADKDFRAALRSAEADMLDTVTRRLSAGQTLALDTLEKLIQSARHESTKLTACVSWLNMFIKYRDMKDIDERLTALEEAINNGNKK